MRFPLFGFLFFSLTILQVWGLGKEDEWTQLLNWLREFTQSDDIDYEEEYPDNEDAVADEPSSPWFGGRRPIVPKNPDKLWNDLVNGVEQAIPKDYLIAEEDEKVIRGASLAFVFDSTGSMGDELNHVKSGAMKILASLRDHPDAPIYNYIWVPFNDPDIGPITVTRDPKLFEQRMSDVVATGGGDCPEMSLGAIRKALGTSLPNSYVYVFTDAPPKDSHLLNEVLSLIQRKQAQVVFIVTDGCLDTEKDNYWVYERIAHTSSGQIYKLTTDEVKEVLKYVKVALQPHVVSLVSLNKPAPDKNYPDKVSVVVDDSLQQFTVSVSGINAKIGVSDPKGLQVDGPPQLEKVLNLANIKVVNVKKPDPGSWSVLIESDSDYTIRSTGLSKVNFNHGFSTKETPNLSETNYRPLKGAKSFVLIQTSDTDEVFNITTLDFVALTGEILNSVNLNQVEGKKGLYKAGSFIPPKDFFYLVVSGFGRDGSPIKRITSTAISAQLPEKPIVTLKMKAIGKINLPGKLDCRVESVVPVTVRWYKNGKYLDKQQTCSETCEFNLVFDKLTPETEGKYFCKAQNIAGSDGREIRLTLVGDPPSVLVKSPVVASLGQTVVLDCTVKSEFPVSVTWAQFTATNQHSGVFHPSSAGVKLDNNSLMLHSVKTEDEGWYICVAKSRAGESQGRILLVIKEPVTVTVKPTTLAFSEGDSARIICSASGKPPPKMEWLNDRQHIKDPSIVVEEIKDSLNLVIDYLEKRHAGLYTCNAFNHEESATATVKFVYKESPKVKAKENNLIVKDGSEAVLKCTATGVPVPVIKWYKEGKQLNPEDDRFEINEGRLVIKVSDASDFGEYSCVAENDQGTSVDHIGLTIGSEPTFLQKPRTREIQLSHSGTIACSAFGVPLPEITWSRADGREMDKTRLSMLPTGALKITKMMYQDDGRYICKAENVFGSISHEVNIKASGVVIPTLDNSTELIELKAISGNELTIPCGIHLGNPPAKVKWIKDGIQIDEETEGFTIKSTGSLVIANASVQSSGNYRCVAENVAGQSTRSFDVIISESPTIIASTETEIKGKIGGEIIIKCHVSGFPVPTVLWTKDGLPLPMSSTIFQDESGSLILKNLSEDNTGVYVCTATNDVGSASKETSIQVQVAPTFADEVEDYPVNVVEGHMVVLNCNASGTPEPSVSWSKDDKPFSIEGNEFTAPILRFFAKTQHTGLFKCIAVNEAGTISREFNVTILVPPKILGRHSDKSIKAKTGLNITLTCNVTGTPKPTILWQRNGMYLTQNSTDMIITNDGSLVIVNVTKDSAGTYTCDAENLGGITQRTHYLQVNYPPVVLNLENDTSITLKEGEEYSLGCMVEGNPKPSVSWKKNGLTIYNNHPDLMILEDNTLVFLQVNREMAGTYRCEVVNSEGFTFKEHKITVIVPPSLTSDFHPTKLEVNEGDSLSLTCPTMLTIPPPNIQWIKDGKPLDLLFQERSDEAQVKMSLDQRTLTIIEAHPVDRGNYSCVATNAAGRTDATFFVDVLMTPHFEEFNHVAHRTILTGGEVVLNCSVSGNPQPKVIWRKENTSITPHNTPGVQVTLDRKHLKIVNGQVDHTGTYVCLATNKVNTKEREFYVTVLEPPQVSGSLQQTVQVLKGDNVTLDCRSTGSPTPKFSWIKKSDSSVSLNYTGDTLIILNAKCEDGGIYICQVSNTAGTRTKYFDVNVLESPKIESTDIADKINGIVGGNITLRCKTTGNPKPDTTWLHNGRIMKRKKRSLKSTDSTKPSDPFASLELTDLKVEDEGTYTLLAFNPVGVVEKDFYIHISEPITETTESNVNKIKPITVVKSFSAVLSCSVEKTLTSPIHWYRNVNDEITEIKSGGNFFFFANELWIKEIRANHSGRYFCTSENDDAPIDSFDVTVVEPPKLRGNTNQNYEVQVNSSLSLYCNITGTPNVTYSWFHQMLPLQSSIRTFVISNEGKTLTINKCQEKDSGSYKCTATNKAGSASMHFHVKVNGDNRSIKTFAETVHKRVREHEYFILNCLTIGQPPPKKTKWFKDNEPIEKSLDNKRFSQGQFYISLDDAGPDDVGHYECVATGNGNEETHYEYHVTVLAPGQWTQWSSWSPCSVSCGSGYETRMRKCVSKESELNLKLTLDISDCVGDSVAKRNCFEFCLGKDAQWSVWSSCSVTCGRGTRKRCKTYRENSSELNLTSETVDCEEGICDEKECPPNGQWFGSEWSLWSPCTRSGLMRRTRLCKKPTQESGVKDCPGPSSETKTCNGNRCRVAGKWEPWSDWSPCSKTCGRGYQRRVRKCIPSKCGRLCKGENYAVNKCFTQHCSNTVFPSSAKVQVKGQLNGNPIDNKLNIKIDNTNEDRHIATNLNTLIQRKDWFPYTPFLFSPISWNTAYETDNADNGLSLTDGNFQSESDIKFSSGEELTVKHKGNGVDENGTFIVEIEVLGEVPIIQPRAVVVINPMEQNLIQTGPRNLYAFMEGNVTVNNRNLSYIWNNSIQYEADKKTMPYLVEKLTMKNISNTFGLDNDKVQFTAASSIGKKFTNNKCPIGFSANLNFMHCEDVDECSRNESPCEDDRLCENTFGSFKCVCPTGFKMTEGRCLDVNECSQTYDMCSHFCHNTPGSFICSCPYGYYMDEDRRSCLEITKSIDLKTFYEDSSMRRNFTTLDEYFDTDYTDKYLEHQAVKRVSCLPGYFFKNNACKDYNECENFKNICDPDETCLNLPGTFQCISTPCPSGYDRIKSNGHCVKICSADKKCQRGAMVSESLIYYPATLNLTHILPLDKVGQPECNVVKTRYKVTDSSRLFQVRMSEGRHFLYPIKKLNRNTLYRVEIEAFSYGPKNELLYFTNIIIFFILN